VTGPHGFFSDAHARRRGGRSTSSVAALREEDFVLRLRLWPRAGKEVGSRGGRGGGVHERGSGARVGLCGMGGEART
jgi:hypothetical protein